MSVPLYSHLAYDILPEKKKVGSPSDIVVVEGLNILQNPCVGPVAPSVFVSDFIDFSIYVDADEKDIARWYVERFQVLRRTAFRDPNSYFHRYADLTEEEAVITARGSGRRSTGSTCCKNILPTRERARLILTKGPDHVVREVKLRKM